MIDIAELRRTIAYDPETGALTWLERPVSDFRDTGPIRARTRWLQWNKRWAGTQAFNCAARSGYRVGNFNKVGVYAHRAAFAIMTGRWPKMIDHRDGDRSNNRWANLREVNALQNMQNNRVRKDSSTGRCGVRPRKGRFIATIRLHGRTTHLGTFDTIEDAALAREAAERTMGFAERHGVASRPYYAR